jgi:hypothetical protein
MKPVEFPQQNVVFAKDQPEYLPLPAFKTHDGEVTSCWGMTWRERLRVLLTGRIYISNLTFNHPLQPQIVTTVPPEPPTHKCGVCESVGNPDPIRGCLRCGCDNMEPIQ